MIDDPLSEFYDFYENFIIKKSTLILKDLERI